MPDKKGRFSGQEKAFVAAMAETGNRGFARHVAGYKSEGSASLVMARPAVQAAIRERELAVIHNELLPLSNHVLREALTLPAVPWGAKMKAVDIVQKRVFGEQEGGSGKTPAEMSPDELSAALDRLKRELSDRSTTVIEHQAEAPETGVFD